MILSRLGMTHPTSMSGGILCDPGQGISVGSLGKARKHETVHAVIVRDVSLAGTMNGVWIKTWQGGRGYVRNILFDRINMIASDHPIIIDQNYRDHEIRCRNQVKLGCANQDVMYRHIMRDVPYRKGRADYVQPNAPLQGHLYGGH
ncbi:polygalacturonase-like isoform X2 [Punica granatum]|uniref:Polygalacturonase-like isoform X2 n=1 Tax=Punica granatum TaxID=22663 RepID=A0A6P8C7Z5_PUNGR|nr:polygalacturonase-like isoform X2 [Punica granatum]